MGGAGRNTACAMLMLLSIIAGVNSYSKYGRGCGDIGCLPNEQCVMTSDACSYSQREGKECGSYPTCAKKSAGAGSSSSVYPSGSALSPGFPHGLQPVNPYNPSFVFGNQPNGFYAPAGTGGPPGGATHNGGMTSHGINYGGALGGYQNPNMYNKPPPQYQNQNQNPYNRQTQSHPSSAVRAGGATASTWPGVALRALGGALCLLLLQQYQVVLGRGST